jgi:cell division protein FtsI (penicillin-binding protein 3)
MKLGIPGIGFRPEKRRFYPGGSTAAHILGHVNVDNRGLAGIERYIDQQGLMDLRESGITVGASLEPIRLSIDLRVQNIVHDVIAKAMVDYQAEAAGAVVLDADTGEVLAMASVPDYDPNQPSRNLADGSVDKEYEKGWFNRMSNATFEMGSTFKSFTLAMGLDEGKVTLSSVIDASNPLRMGGFTIGDDHGQYRPLSVPEIFQYSSNIGTAGIASGRSQRSSGIPDPAGFAVENGHGAARGRDTFTAARVEEDQPGNDLVRSWCRNNTIADRRGGCGTGQWRQADRAHFPSKNPRPG